MWWLCETWRWSDTGGMCVARSTQFKMPQGPKAEETSAESPWPTSEAPLQCELHWLSCCAGGFWSRGRPRSFTWDCLKSQFAELAGNFWPVYSTVHCHHFMEAPAYSHWLLNFSMLPSTNGLVFCSQWKSLVVSSQSTAAPVAGLKFTHTKKKANHWMCTLVHVPPPFFWCL